MDTQQRLVCPACGKVIDPDTDEMVWTYQMKFYCREACVRSVAARKSI